MIYYIYNILYALVKHCTTISFTGTNLYVGSTDFRAALPVGQPRRNTGCSAAKQTTSEATNLPFHPMKYGLASGTQRYPSISRKINGLIMGYQKHSKNKINKPGRLLFKTPLKQSPGTTAVLMTHLTGLLPDPVPFAMALMFSSPDPYLRRFANCRMKRPNCQLDLWFYKICQETS